MPSIQVTDLDLIARDMRLPIEQVRHALDLLEDGNTVPFVAHFRKDETGGLTEEQVLRIGREAMRQRLLAERKQTILKSIASQGKLTPTLEKSLRAAPTAHLLEDLYLPFKPRKQTLAMQARQRGLESLALAILEADSAVRDLTESADPFVSLERDLASTAEVLQGVGHLIAERFSECAELRARLRKRFRESGQLVTTKIEPARVAEEESRDRNRQRREKAFADYFAFRESITDLPPHRILAINRGSRAKILRVKIECDLKPIVALAMELLVDEEHPHGDFLRGCVRDALSRLVFPSLERELRRELTEKAEEHAVGVFVRNLRSLLLQPPVLGRRILAIDPGFRSGCKLAALDEFGNVLETGAVHVIGGEEQLSQARTFLADVIRRLDISVVAIGNGTACRETEQMVSQTLVENPQEERVSYVIVNEAGTAAYSTSPVGCEELPEYDVEERGAISIGRRLMDPLSELVKINPAHIGVGLYQHDVKARHLRESLDAVVQSCVNYVGVDVNRASPALLSYVSGLNQLTARRLYDHRCAHGPFRDRSQFQEVPGIGAATIVQAAGFLKISDGDNPLDATWIHPESYDVARRVLQHLGSSVEELAQIMHSHTPSSVSGPMREVEVTADAPSRSLEALSQRVAAVDVDALAAELQVGPHRLEDILSSLAKPGRDPRDDLPPPVFRTEIMKLDDLKPGTELTGTVLNVVDFGAFVDIGITDSALVHISQLADRFVRDPHELVSVGDTLTLWVREIDKARRRVSLTAIRPGTEKRRLANNRAPASAAASEMSTHRKKKEGAKKEGAKKAGAKEEVDRNRSVMGAGKHARSAKRRTRPPKRKEPRRPITDAMIDGREPMRSFSDLAQFYEKQQPEDDEESSQRH